MKRFLLYSVAALALVATAEAQSPSRVRICYMVGDVCTNVDEGHPLPTLAAAGGVSGSGGGGSSGGGVLTPTGRAALAVSTISAEVALPNADPVVLIKNTGSVSARFALGSSPVTATSSSYLIGAGESIAVSTTGHTHVAGITATSSTNFELTQGSLETATSGGGGGGGGSVTQGTIPWVVSQSGAWSVDAVQSGTWNTNATVIGAVTVTGGVAATQSGTWNVNAIQSGAWTASVTGTVAATQSGAWTVTGAGGTFPATQSGAWTVGQTGTWTVQPGNTANTTAWLVTGTGGTFPATQSGTWSTRTLDGAGTALTSATRGAQQALSVQIVDAAGAQITAFGGSGGTASNFGSAFPSSGTAIGLSDGTNMRAHLGAANALNSTGQSLATAQIIGQFDDASPTAITENSFGNLRMSANRNFYTTLRDAAGNERGANVNASNELTVACTTGCSGGTFNNNADAVATSSTNGQVAAWPYTFNGTTWDRRRSAVNATNSVGTGIAASAGLAQYDDTSPTAITENSFGNIRMSANRNQYMTIRDAAGNERGMNVNASGQASVSVDAGAVFNSNGRATAGNSSPVVQPSGSMGQLVAAASTNATSLKASAGVLFGVQVYNNSANIAYLKFYNVSSAPTCNSSTVVKTIMIPASTSGAGSNAVFGPGGVAFGTGIGYCITGGIANNDNTAVAASAIVVNIDYE